MKYVSSTTIITDNIVDIIPTPPTTTTTRFNSTSYISNNNNNNNNYLSHSRRYRRPSPPPPTPSPTPLSSMSAKMCLLLAIILSVTSIGESISIIGGGGNSGGSGIVDDGGIPLVMMGSTGAGGAGVLPQHHHRSAAAVIGRQYDGTADDPIANAINTIIAKRSQSSAGHHQQALPECMDDKSVCGYVQLNNMGISWQPICRCRGGGHGGSGGGGGVQCPMMWNPMDGRTISHGNDQYKYCNRAPILKHCGKDDIVYTSYLETSYLTMDINVNTNHIHCQCPGHHLFVRNGTTFDDIDDTTAIIATQYQCKTPPVCSLAEACMGITESPHSRFVTRNCVCPLGTFCPTDIRLAAERVDLNRGAYYIMNCI
ncbi:uncharacterized protein LOC128966170 [Oppia nitens]|uniref:uncharacterized protein LOC128966170 n=1 Tax=Oppia nitens TaxID=1686743 RepID=UPI0023DABD94|nr:uncharacterized protein LOC128966170 [Oppia nitens]